MGWREEVVFDGISWAEHFCIFQSWDESECFELYLFGQGGGEAIDIDFAGVASFWFDKKLVAILFAESVYFIFDTGAVSRAKSLDASIEHGRLVEACFEGIVYLLVGVCNIAG